MAQISRPFQIALAAVALLGIVWIVALHRPGGSSSSAKSSAEQEVAAASKSSSSGSGASGASGAYHGSAPGVAGLTNDIAKAHGAVATSQANAKQLEAKSAQASSSATPTTGASTGAASAASPAKTATAAAPKATVRVTHVAVHSTAAITAARQHLVEAALHSGHVVVLLFWNPKGADDVAVERAVNQLAHSDHSVVAIFSAADQVATFGTITRGVQVYGTPTVLIVAKSGKTQTLTGLQDAYAMRQAISQVSHH